MPVKSYQLLIAFLKASINAVFSTQQNIYSGQNLQFKEKPVLKILIPISFLGGLDKNLSLQLT